MTVTWIPLKLQDQFWIIWIFFRVLMSTTRSSSDFSHDAPDPSLPPWCGPSGGSGSRWSAAAQSPTGAELSGMFSLQYNFHTTTSCRLGSVWLAGVFDELTQKSDLIHSVSACLLRRCPEKDIKNREAPECVGPPGSWFSPKLVLWWLILGTFTACTEAVHWCLAGCPITAQMGVSQEPPAEKCFEF